MKNFFPDTNSNLSKKQARRYALLALWLTFLMVIPISLAFLLKSKALLIVSVLFLHWGIPVIMNFFVEKRGIYSLGLVLQKDQISRYFVYTVIGFVILILIHGGEWALLRKVNPDTQQELIDQRTFFVGLLIQLGTVGLPEEFFYRGFLQTRFCEWLGSRKGLLLSSAIFGMVHVFSRLMVQGFSYTIPAVIIGVTTFISGLIFGILYLKTGSIFPSATAHIFLNLFPSFI